MPAQQHLGEMDEMVHGSDHLKGGDGADHGHDDADDLPGSIVGRGVHTGSGQDDDSGRTGQADADAAEAGTDDDE